MLVFQGHGSLAQSVLQVNSHIPAIDLLVQNSNAELQVLYHATACKHLVIRKAMNAAVDVQDIFDVVRHHLPDIRTLFLMLDFPVDWPVKFEDLQSVILTNLWALNGLQSFGISVPGMVHQHYQHVALATAWIADCPSLLECSSQSDKDPQMVNSKVIAGKATLTRDPSRMDQIFF
ncbi:hypothetical protein C8J56DRAFT_1029244 [Mycena floridula]|nr:hypothetical protein C8J56DRAFT_1029244 [Mycena floridula]